ATLGKVSPNTARRIYEQIWGDLYQDDSLTLRERTIATIAALTAMGGAETNLALQATIALNLGIRPAEIVALVQHIGAAAGFPRSQAALRMVQEVFTQRAPIADGSVT